MSASSLTRQPAVLGSLLALTALSCARMGYAPASCAAVDCSGHGTCVTTTDGAALCACDPGYHNTAALTCEVDAYQVIEGGSDAASAADAGTSADSGSQDARRDAASDAGAADGASADLGVVDTGPDAAAEVDAGSLDAATTDGSGLPDSSIWIYIAAGSFGMGCSLGDADCENDEEPLHTVAVEAFYLHRTEVTQAQYQAVIGSNPSSFSTCGTSCPVENLSLSSARAYCAAIGGRLPSEAEWEYANRAGSTTPFSCGTLVSCISTYAWSFANSDTGSGRQPHPVATKRGNAWGLYDMNGNVWEWVEDCYHSDYTDAPTTGDVWAGGDCGYGVIRGLGYSNGERFMRVSFRSRSQPDDLSSGVGMRCARDAP